MKKYNWVLEITKGLLILIFGLFCLVNPSSATITLTWIFAIMMLIMSIVAITDAFLLKSMFKQWWILLIEFLIGIVIAVILLFNPDKMLLVIRLVGSWAIVTGLFRVVRLIARKDMWIQNILIGLGVIAAGVLFLIIPDVILTSVTLIIGAAAGLFGIIVIIFGVRMKLGKAK
jgi:uncharacterized membrane protein HdeD (DUF308 family)